MLICSETSGENSHTVAYLPISRLHALAEAEKLTYTVGFSRIRMGVNLIHIFELSAYFLNTTVCLITIIPRDLGSDHCKLPYRA